MNTRGELIEVCRDFIVGEVGADMGLVMTLQAERLAAEVLAWLATKADDEDVVLLTADNWQNDEATIAEIEAVRGILPAFVAALTEDTPDGAA